MLRIRDYFVISVTFLALTVFFLVFHDSYSLDQSVSDVVVSGSAAIFAENDEEKIALTEYMDEERPMVLILTGSGSQNESSEQVTEVISALKRPWYSLEKISDATEEQLESSGIIIAAVDSLSDWEEAEETIAYVEEEGIHLIVTTCSGGEDGSEISEKLGILESSGETEIEGMVVFEGILMQGRKYYDDLPLEVEDLSLDAYCTVWIKDRIDQKENGDIPVMWERSLGSGDVFVMNHSLLSGGYGSGLLTGIISRYSETFVYPVVNAKVELVDYFPDVSNGEETVLETLYSRTETAVVRDIFWPSLSKIMKNIGLTATFFTHVSDEEKENSTYQYLEDLITKAGYLLVETEIDNVTELLNFPVLCVWNSGGDESMLTADGWISTAGLLSHYIDMREVLGENGEDIRYEWTQYSRELATFMDELYGEADWIDSVSLQEGVARYQVYCELQPEITITEKGITIENEGLSAEAYFVVRTSRKLQDIGTGCETEQIDGEYYLVRVTDEDAEILFEE
ncbi:MAG: DUF2194 domain-containing protein [Lachnospiraceae bacterium]|nr:DUF2194 domain-containing protein [Lachnospiraceae bacterium]